MQQLPLPRMTLLLSVCLALLFAPGALAKPSQPPPESPGGREPTGPSRDRRPAAGPRPEAARPGSARPGATGPEAARPGSARPGATGSEAARSSGEVMTLADAIAFARRHNLQLKSSRVDVKSATVARRLSWGLLGPHFSFGADLNFLGGETTFDSANLGGGMSFDQDSIVRMCNQPGVPDSTECLQWMQENGLYTGLLLGEVFSGFGSIGDVFNADTVKLSLGGAWQVLNWSSLVNLRRAKLTQKLSRTAYRDTDQEVVTSVSIAYYAVLAAHESVEILEQTSKATEEHLRQARALMAAGVGTNLDVLRWQAKVADDEQKMLEARQQVKNAKINLNNLLGRRLGAPLTLQVPSAIAAERLARPDRVADPSSTHPRLQLSRVNRNMKEVDHLGSKAAFLPTVTVSGGINWQHFLPYEDVATGTSWIQSWAVMVSVKVPIFDSMTKVYDMQMKELAVAKARLEEHNLRRFLRAQVMQSDLEVHRAYSQIEVAKKQVKLAEEAHKSAENLYQAGSAKTTDLLDAQNSLVMARFSLLSARYSYLMALVKRDRAVGAIRTPGGGS